MAKLQEVLATGRRDHHPTDAEQEEQVDRRAGSMQGRFGHLRRRLDKALRLAPDQADGCRPLEITMARQGSAVDSEASSPQAVLLRPDLVDIQLGLGLALERPGRLDEVATSDPPSLRLEPDGPEAFNDLGIALARQGRLDEAAARFQQAIALMPDYPDGHNNLGNILEKQDRLDEAAACYQRALRLKPDYPEAHYNLGIVLARQDRLDDAVASYQQALGLKPDYLDAHNNLGTVLARQQKLDEAVASYQRAIHLNPSSPGAHNNLGLSLARQGKLDEAVASYRRAIRLKPDDAEVQNNLGIVVAKQDKLGEAEACFQQAIGLRPGYPEAHNNLGSILDKQDRFDEAVACFQRAIGLKPDYPEAHNHLGIALWKQGRVDEAVASYQQALRFRPDYPEAHWNRGLVWLTMGHLEQGWTGYEWRWKCQEFNLLPPLQAPLWDGSPLDGRTILVRAEQGLGDTLQFIRYLPLVQRRGGRVILVCQSPLVRLLSRSRGLGVERLLAHGDPLPEHDVHVPLLSLPGLLGTTLESVPADVPYLEAEPQRVAAWRQRLGSYRGLKIGIVWQGNPDHRMDRFRSTRLTQFASLARVPGVHLFSLQKGPEAEQLAALAGDFPVTDLGSGLEDFADTAAALKNLDLVVSVDTSVAHLAGALGVPVWVALPFVAEWRWLMSREDSPWYPTMRLFRQTGPGQWEGVFRRIAEALRRRMAAPAELRPITVEIAPGELFDKITILEIKSERITDAAKRHHVGTELARLVAARDCTVPGSAELTRLETELKEVNEALWQIEDDIRLCERDEDFGPRFISLARSVYHTNDRRAALKRQINELLGTDLMEEKSYVSGEEPTDRQDLQSIEVTLGVSERRRNRRLVGA